MVETRQAPRARGAAPMGAFLLCSSIWGSTFLFISIGNDTVPPFWAATLRLGLAAPILGVIALLARQPFPRGADLRAVALYGFFGFGLNFPLLYWGERVIPSGLAAVLFATIPLSTALFSAALGVQRLTRRQLLAALVGLVGVGTIFSGQLAGGGLGPALVVLAGATFASVSGVVLHRAGRQAPIPANAVGAAVGFVCCLAFSLVAGERHALPTTFEAIFPIVYLTVAGSIVAYVAMVWLINVWGANRASFVTLVIPVVAVALGVLVRDERFPPLALLGAAIVLLGVFLGVIWKREPGGR